MGRTGAFICMCSEIERIKMEASADIFQSVKAARNQRPYMVSTVVSFPMHHYIRTYIRKACLFIKYVRRLHT